MPTGHADYTLDVDVIAQSIGNLSIDIAQQSLSEIQNRPKYGSAIATKSDITLTANTPSQLISIGGTGVIYGASFFISSSSIIDLDTIHIETDGDSWGLDKLLDIFERNASKPVSSLLWLTRWDKVNDTYALELGFGLTFEQSLSIIYKENQGRTPTVNSRVLFALV